MIKNEIYSKIRDYIEESSLSDTGKIKDDTLIFDDGLLDSMGLLFLIEFLNENFKVEVSEDELQPKHFESINNIVDFVNNKLE